jgi:glycosyltransferase involved in cell wall biosynthesis
MSKRLLIVSPHFPPVNAPDMQRVRTSLPHFIAAGWEVTVLTVNDSTPTAPLEPELVKALPPEARIERVHCFSRKWTGKFGLNNVALRSLPFLFLRGCQLLASRRYDAVYFSTTMFIVLPFGRIWKALFGTPYVIDLQDPWVTDYYQRPGAPPPPGGWKYRVAHTMARVLEKWSFQSAAHLIVVSRAYELSIKTRHPELVSLATTEIPFGAAETDLDWVRAHRSSRASLLPAGGVRLAFAGALGPGMMPSIEVLFAGIAAARREGLDVRAYFFGTTYSPDAKPATHAAALRHGLQHCVQEEPARLRYFDALQITVEADANLVLGSTDLAFTPSKILTVLAAGRPVLALAPAGSAMLQRLASLDEPAISFTTDNPASAVAEIVEYLRRIATQTAPRHSDAWKRLGAAEVAAAQLRILDSSISPASTDLS